MDHPFAFVNASSLIRFCQLKNRVLFVLLTEKFPNSTLFIYMDNIIITGNNQLTAQFFIQDLGSLNQFLRTEFSNIILSPQKHILKFRKTKMEGLKLVQTSPSSSSNQSKCTDEPLSDLTMYRQTFGRVQYVRLTRQHLAFAITKVH